MMFDDLLNCVLIFESELKLSFSNSQGNGLFSSKNLDASTNTTTCNIDSAVAWIKK